MLLHRWVLAVLTFVLASYPLRARAQYYFTVDYNASMVSDIPMPPGPPYSLHSSGSYNFSNGGQFSPINGFSLYNQYFVNGAGQVSDYGDARYTAVNGEFSCHVKVTIRYQGGAPKPKDDVFYFTSDLGYAADLAEILDPFGASPKTSSTYSERFPTATQYLAKRIVHVALTRTGLRPSSTPSPVGSPARPTPPTIR